MSIATFEPVFIVDDDPAAHESVAALVRSHGLEAETFESAEDFLARFDRQRDGCLIIDMRMSGMCGLKLQELLRAEGVELPVIIITGYGDVSSAVQAMRGGAQTFLEKPCNDQQLWEAICRALACQVQSRSQRAQRAQIRSRLAMLTPEEHQVLQKLVAGNPNKTIAKELDLGLRTVELRRANILQKMQAASLAELVRMVVAAGAVRDSTREFAASAEEGQSGEAAEPTVNSG